MKKLLVIAAVLCGLVSLAGPTPTSAAMNAGTLTISYGNQQFEISSTTLNATVGDTFTIQNNLQQTNLIVVNGTGSISDTILQTQCGSGGPSFCNLLASTSIPLAVGSIGDFKIYRDDGPNQMVFDGGDTLLFTVTVGSGGGGGGPAVVVKGSLDPDGGTCTWNGQPLTKKTEFFVVGFTYAPGPSECVKNGYALTGWREGNGPSLPSLIDPSDAKRRYFMAQTGNYVAIWKLVPDAPEFALASSVKPCGPCRIDVSWIPARALNTSYEVELWNGDTLLQTVTSSAITTTFSGVAAEKDYTIRLYSVLDGVRSAGPAVTGASTMTAKTITVFGARGTVDGNVPAGKTCQEMAQSSLPAGCVRVDGFTTGLSAGTELIPWYRFPGQTTYTDGLPVVVGADGQFTWHRKTGKKIYVYFEALDLSVRSDRIIIPAR